MTHDDGVLARHLNELASWTASGGPLSPGSPAATTNSSAYVTEPGRPPRLTPQRERLHREILAEYFAEHPDIPRDGQAVITAGPPGAGKGSTLRARLGDDFATRYRVIDPDEFKIRLLRKLEHGAHGASLPDPEIPRTANDPPIPPGELAALIHEESSQLAKRAASQSIRRGENIVLDGLNSKKAKLLRHLAALTQSRGTTYTDVQVLLVDASYDTSRARVAHRHGTAYTDYLAGDTDQGYEARYVPTEVTDELYDNDRARSACYFAVAEFIRTPEAREIRASAAFFRVDRPDGNARLEQEVHYTPDGKRRTSRYPDTDPDSTPDTGPTQPDDAPSGGSVDVQIVPGYTKSDGTTVSGYIRRTSRP